MSQSPASSSTVMTHESCIPSAPSITCQRLIHAENLLSAAVATINSGRSLWDLKVKPSVNLESHPQTSEPREAAPSLQEEVAPSPHLYSAISK